MEAGTRSLTLYVIIVMLVVGAVVVFATWLSGVYRAYTIRNAPVDFGKTLTELEEGGQNTIIMFHPPWRLDVA